MPSNDDILRLRRMTGEVDASAYTNTDMTQYIEEAGSLNAAAAIIWGEKASAYADLVNITEAGSSRSNSDLYRHAVERQAYFTALASEAPAAAASSTTRRIVRA